MRPILHSWKAVAHTTHTHVHTQTHTHTHTHVHEHTTHIHTNTYTHTHTPTSMMGFTNEKVEMLYGVIGPYGMRPPDASPPPTAPPLSRSMCDGARTPCCLEGRDDWIRRKVLSLHHGHAYDACASVDANARARFWPEVQAISGGVAGRDPQWRGTSTEILALSRGSREA